MIDISGKQLKSVWDNEAGLRAQRYLRQRYYAGDHEVLPQSYREDGMIPHNLVLNFCELIADQHASFSLSNRVNYLPASETSDRKGIDYLNDIYNNQNLSTVDLNHFVNAVVSDYSVEVLSLDKAVKAGPDILVSARYNPLDWRLVFDERGNLVLAVYHSTVQAGTVVEGEILDKALEIWTTYDDVNIVEWRMSDLKELVPISKKAHLAGMVPVNYFQVDDDLKSHFLNDPILRLVQGYNQNLSLMLDDCEWNVHSALVIESDNPEELFRPEVIQEKIIDPETGIVTQEEILGSTKAANIVKFRLFPVSKGCSVKAIDRGNDVEMYGAVEKTLRQSIHQAGRIVDLDRVASATGTVSGIALKLMFSIQIQQAAFFQRYFERGLRRRIDIVNSINKNFPIRTQVEDFTVQFTSAVPVEIIPLLNVLPIADLLSKRDMISLLPLSSDPAEILARKDEEDEKAEAKGARVAPQGVEIVGGRKTDAMMKELEPKR